VTELRRPVDPIALALAAAIWEIAAREAAERAERRATMAIVKTPKGGRAA
jgi:hypothetical protein